MTDRSQTLFQLARMMIKQARMLRDAGLVAEARALAKRAIAMDSCGWAARSPQPVPVRIRQRR